MFDIIWISTSFLCGLLAFWGKLPPLIGYLCAGFILYFFGVTDIAGLDELSELGISILLFCIGLKLDLKSLIKSEILGVALSQTLISFVILFALNALVFKVGDIASSGILAFGLTFSSTILAVKVLEQRGDFGTKYGKIAIGVLIIQDILAVLFMAFGTQKVPSAWFLVLVVSLYPIRLVLSKILERLQNQELVLLFGLTVSLGGAYLFDLVNVKGDIGALIFGIILAKHDRANELNRGLVSFKNFFLLGFFLSVGMLGLPNINQILTALGITLFLPLRLIIYFVLFNRSRLRNRNSLLASCTLTNFSEFGLIVCSFAVSNGMLNESWLTTLALVLSFSFVISSILNSQTDKLYLRYSSKLQSFQSNQLRDYEKDISLNDVNVLVIGMGRVGKGAYRYLDEKEHFKPLGIELNETEIVELQKENINSISGNATSPDFWSRVNLKTSSVELILLAMPIARQNSITAEIIRMSGFKGKISATSKNHNDEEFLKESGIDNVFNLYAEAGTGFAQSSCP